MELAVLQVQMEHQVRARNREEGALVEGREPVGDGAHGMLADADLKRISAVLAAAGLDRQPPQCGAARALEYMRVDKKVKSGRVRLILLEQIGRAIISADYADAALDATLLQHFG